MRSSVKMNCPSCKHSILQPFVEPCCNCNDGSEFKPKTNADRIRSMTDEEMAKWYYTEFFGQVPYCQEDCPEHNDCPTCLLDWLKQEGE